MRKIEATGTPRELEALSYTNLTWDSPANQSRGQLTSDERMPSVVLEPSGGVQPLLYSSTFDAERVHLPDALTGRAMSFEAFLNRRVHSDALLIAHDNRVVYENYFNGMTESDPHLCHSCTKTLTTMQVGIAVDEGRLSTQQLVRELIPELHGIRAWSSVSVQNLLDMATGIHSEEHYEDPSSMYFDYARAVGYWGPSGGQGALDFVTRRLVTESSDPGTIFNYASYNTNLLPRILESVYGVPAGELYERDLYRRIGVEDVALINTDAQGDMIVEGQLSLRLRDFYRWGRLLAHEGRNLIGEQVIPQTWIDESVRWDEDREAAFARSGYSDLFQNGSYRNQLWRPDARNGVIAMLGIYGQFFYIDLVNQIEIVGFSSYPEMTSNLMAANLKALWAGVTKALVE